MRKAERGISLLFVAVVVLVLSAAILAFLALTRTSVDVDRSSQTGVRLATVQSALEQFASTTERLPCPANPAIDTGDAEPAGASVTCNFPAGTVPWRTIGLRRDDSLDAWGWKIGYRVYAGATGLTQAGGGSMVHCDTVEPTPTGTTASGLCRPTHDTTEAQFLAGKGLAVSNFGAPTVTDAAYVLISHGVSGLGAYTTAGQPKQPNPVNVDELANLGSAGPFVAKVGMTTVAADDATHFDDVLAYRRLADFVKRANLAARDWPEIVPPLVSLTFDTATLTSALGSAVSYGNTGRSSLGFANATVSAFDGGGTENLSFSTLGGLEGIGGVNGTPLISSAAAEGVRIDLIQKAQQLAVTFFDFGRRAATVREQVQFTFFDGTTPLAPVVTGQGCHNDGDLATFSIDAGALFDHVEIRSLPATTDGSASEFLFLQLTTCVAGTACKTSLSTSGNLC